MAHDDRSGDSERLRTWSHPAAISGPPAVDRATGSWLAVLGNPTRADLAAAADIQQRLLTEALDDLDGLLASLSPPWALVFADRRTGAVHVAADACGLQHLYLREEPDGTAWVSSSLLALGEVLGGTLDHDAAAEWLTGGHFMSERTVLKEIRKVGAGETLRFDAGGTTSRRRPAPPDGAGGADAAYRTAFLDALRATPRDEPALGELTGGLDSRLVL